MTANELQPSTSRFEKSKLVPPIEQGGALGSQESSREVVREEPTSTENKADQAAPETRFHFPTLHRPKKLVIPVKRDEITLSIEKVLEDGLGDSYQRLSPVAKQEFKIKGEEVAIKIRDLMNATHIKAKKIFKLIFEWLKLLPGVNRFFLEQEAKIKTDRIVHIKNRE
jgi:hypothetical protein